MATLVRRVASGFVQPLLKLGGNSHIASLSSATNWKMSASNALCQIARKQVSTFLHFNRHLWCRALWIAGNSDRGHTLTDCCGLNDRSLLSVDPTVVEARRNKIYFSRHKGKPKSVKAVTERFMRLNSGLWIRPRAGRSKKLWKKSSERKYRLRQHVFLNKQQSKLLDKMTEGYWKDKKFYVDDPYEPYQERYALPQYWYKPPPFLP